ncbi:MAG: hypothetical protein KAH32_07345 [Chlamydiia bacterium]|nr:hypothetical protein [Chlamydiia bacterium]
MTTRNKVIRLASLTKAILAGKKIVRLGENKKWVPITVPELYDIYDTQAFLNNLHLYRPVYKPGYYRAHYKQRTEILSHNGKDAWSVLGAGGLAKYEDLTKIEENTRVQFKDYDI